MNGTEWTEGRVAELTELWAAGLSCTVIAKEMGGLTRNAIIGKVNRLKLPPRRTTMRSRKRKNGRTHPWAPTRTPPEPDGPLPLQQASVPVPPACGPIPTSDPQTVLTIARTGQCRWPISGEFEATLFCGAVCDPTLPYCVHHCALAYRPDRKRGTVEAGR